MTLASQKSPRQTAVCFYFGYTIGYIILRGADVLWSDIYSMYISRSPSARPMHLISFLSNWETLFSEQLGFWDRDSHAWRTVMSDDHGVLTADLGAHVRAKPLVPAILYAIEGTD